MKKLILGCTSFLSGFIGLTMICTVRALYPYSYDWDGSIIFFGFLSNSHMTLLFLSSIFLCIFGGLISYRAVYKNKN